jgi:hypothetical protein
MTARTVGTVKSLLVSAPAPAGTEQAIVEIARYVVGEAVWAPSVHNTQPWWFVADPDGLSLLLPPSLFEHPAVELSVDDSAQLGEERRQPDHIA